MRRLIPAALIACAFAACAPIPTAPTLPPPTAPKGFPAKDYLQDAARGAPVFRLDPTHSLVVVRVYRGGALARFGHDHVVAIRDIHGFVRLSRETGARRADLYAALASMRVDEPALRARAGFDTQPSEQDIAGTRHNMLDKVLEAGRFPFVSIHLDHVVGDAPTITVNAVVSLHGRTHALPVTVELNTPDADTIHAHGNFSVKQTDFGMVPYSLLGGALRVENRIDIEFDLAATRVVVNARREGRLSKTN